MTRLVVLAGFLVAFAAGLAVGVRSYRATAQPTTRPSRHGGGGWLATELGLTSQQQQELHNIWSETARRGEREQAQQRRQLAEREREAAIAGLIRPEDKPKYEAIQKQYADQMSAQEREWRDSYQAAVQRTRQILTPEQRAKYDELLRKREAEHAGRQRHRGEHERHSATRPMSASRPASQP